MMIFKRKSDLGNYLARQCQSGKKIGFVPTMGALHAGHISLIESSRRDNSITVCSIFVNPTQFNDPNDFKKYPVTIDRDINMLEGAGCNVLFLPAVDEIYPGGTTAAVHYDLGFIETILEGQYRPGHFQGVCMVVHRLLDIVAPDNLYLGQKDYQQCMVIKKLVGITGHTKTSIIICPTLREADGLAMSSRNMRLNKSEREKAPAIYSTLNFIKNNLTKGDLSSLKETALQKLAGNGFRPDYIEIANADTLNLVKVWDGKEKLVVVVAAYLNDVRLIDNIRLN